MDEIEINAYFNKKFSFSFDNTWFLPDISMLYTENIWVFDPLMEIKNKLNRTKSLLNDKGEEWHEHTSSVDKAGLVGQYVKSRIRPELYTQAWCKFLEVLSSYNLFPADLQQFNSLHLCEAPGGFISALNFFLQFKSQCVSWNWIGNTLNPYYEGHNLKDTVTDDRLLFPTRQNWYFGSDDTGNITDSTYRDDLNYFLEKKGPFKLVTADGSINCLHNPAEQELVVADLHLAETFIALKNLEKGGSLVLKKFTFFECTTICKIYFFNCAFEKVHVFKPFTSKAGNSEVYLICIGYMGNEKLMNYISQLCLALSLKKDKALFPLNSLPDSFLIQLVECSNMFFEHQKSAIEENLHLYSTNASEWKEQYENLKEVCAKEYLMRYDISLNDFSYKKLFSTNASVLSCLGQFGNGRTRTKNNKAMYFLAMGETYDCIQRPLNYIEIVYDVEKRINACFPSTNKRSLDTLEWCCVWKDVSKRMKSKSYENWSLLGRKLTRIENSKFCNPLLLHLWNRLSFESEVKVENHTFHQQCYWDLESASELLKDNKVSNELNLVSFTETGYSFENDSIFVHLKSYFNVIDDSTVVIQAKNKVFYINSSLWSKSLHQELAIKKSLTMSIINVLKVIGKGEDLIVCMQSALTRYTAGLIFILLSLFEKFQCFLPSLIAPTVCGQMWVYKNFLAPEWTSRSVRHLEKILNYPTTDCNEILQIVPIGSLCSGSFYAFLLNLNNRLMLQRIESLIQGEKKRLNL